MAHVKYVGRSDERVLNAADFKALGVEDVTKTVFPRGHVVEVPDGLAVVLTQDIRLKGQFETVHVAEVGEPQQVEGTPVETDKTTAKKKAEEKSRDS